MDDTVFVIMLKDAETGFLEKELGAYTLPENSGLIFNIYAEKEGADCSHVPCGFHAGK